MKARIVITTDGQISVFTDEGTLQSGSLKIAELFSELEAQGVALDWDGQVEQHRHDDSGDVETVQFARQCAGHCSGHSHGGGR